MNVRRKQSNSPDQDRSRILERSFDEDRSGLSTVSITRPTNAVSPEPMMLLTVVVDVSGSMVFSGALPEVTACLPQFKASVLQHSLLARKLNWSLITFDDTVHVIDPFQPVTRWTPPELSSGGGTAPGTAILEALRLQERYVQDKAAEGIATQQKVMVLLSDCVVTSEPADCIEKAIVAIAEAEKDPAFTFLPIVVEGSDFQVMSRLTKCRQPLGMNHLDISKFFRWLSIDVLRVASMSVAGQRTKIANPIKSAENPDGWAYVGKDHGGGDEGVLPE